MMLHGMNPTKETLDAWDNHSKYGQIPDIEIELRNASNTQNDNKDEP